MALMVSSLFSLKQNVGFVCFEASQNISGCLPTKAPPCWYCVFRSCTGAALDPLPRGFGRA